MSLKQCEKKRATVDQSLDELVQLYEDECGRLCDAIADAYAEGFKDARSDIDNNLESCWKASTAKQEQES